MPLYNLLQVFQDQNQICSISIARMTTNNRASTASPQVAESKFASAPLTIYILSYNAKDWGNGVALLDGSKPRDEFYGTLDPPYRSLSVAQDAGIEWALKQLQDRLDRYDPPLESEKDRDAEFDAWPKSESEPGDNDIWSYTISKGNETLVVRAEKFVVYGSYASESDDDGRGGLVAGEGDKNMKGNRV
ncbi:MAG: hypothetical protein Q9175_002387 [Cornicularia normoerica]